MQMSQKMLVADDSLAVHQVFRNALSVGHFAKIVHAFDGWNVWKRSITAWISRSLTSTCQK